MKWLEEAEEDSEESEDDDDIEVAFDERSREVGTTISANDANKTNGNSVTAKPIAEEVPTKVVVDDEELDIDDI